LLLFLVACGWQPRPGPLQSAAETAVPTKLPPVTLTVGALMQRPAQWSGREVRLIAVVHKSNLHLLSPYLIAAGEDSTVPDDTRLTLWLAEALPVTVASELNADATVLRLRGRLSPPGAYGAHAEYPYQFSADDAAVLRPEQTTIASVAANPHALDAVLITLNGVLLTAPEGALLLDAVGDGGVPAADARQIKIRDLAPGQIPDTLQLSGDVRYGPVEVVGWWRDQALTPLIIQQPAPTR